MTLTKNKDTTESPTLPKEKRCTEALKWPLYIGLQQAIKKIDALGKVMDLAETDKGKILSPKRSKR